MSIENSYFGRVGRLLDIALNVIVFGGKPSQTVSENAADAMSAGQEWGCVACKALSVIVQRGHCLLVLQDAPMSTLALVRAVIAILAVFVGIGFGIHEVINLIF